MVFSSWPLKPLDLSAVPTSGLPQFGYTLSRSLSLLVVVTFFAMGIDYTYGLQVAVDDGGTYKFEPSPFEIFRHPV